MIEQRLRERGHNRLVLLDKGQLLSTKNDTAKAINYLFNRWAAFTRFLDDGRVVLRTTPPNERCGVWRSEEETGPLPVRTLAVTVLPPSIP